jgi:hypothetical protein
MQDHQKTVQDHRKAELRQSTRQGLRSLLGFLGAMVLALFSIVLAFIAMWFGEVWLLAFFLMALTALLFSVAFSYDERLRDLFKKSVQMPPDLAALSVYKDITEGRKRDFTLYLRPFYSEGKLFVVTGGHSNYPKFEWLFEHMLARAVRRSGPVVALGKPGEQQFGSVLVGEAEWRETATKLIDHATRVVCVPSCHAGTLWEIDHILARGHLHKTVFIMPPRNPRPKGERKLKKSELEDDELSPIFGDGLAGQAAAVLG